MVSAYRPECNKRGIMFHSRKPEKRALKGFLKICPENIRKSRFSEAYRIVLFL